MSYVDNRALSAVCSSHPFGCVFKVGALKSFQPIRVSPRTTYPFTVAKSPFNLAGVHSVFHSNQQKKSAKKIKVP